MDRAVFSFGFLEEVIGRDKQFVFSLVSFVAILVILLNQVFVSSIFVGAVASVIFFVINVVFLGRGFFAAENLLTRFLLGGLALLAFLGLVGWVIMIAFGLDVWMSVVVLLVVGVCSSVLSRVRGKNPGRQIA